MHHIGLSDGSPVVASGAARTVDIEPRQRTALPASVYASPAQMPGIHITAFGDYQRIPILAGTGDDD